MHLGSDWAIDEYLTFPCNTHNATGAATDADSVPTYRVYEDETSTAILTGSTAKLDDANTVGFYSERVQLLTASGFEAGKCYTIYISATVGGVVATMAHTFKIAPLVETYSWVELMRLVFSALLGLASGLATTTARFRDKADTKDRITATVDANGNRTAVTLDATP